MDDPAERLEFNILTGEIKSATFSVRPLVAYFPAWPRLTDTHRHRPSSRAEQPLLDDRRFGVRAVQSLRWGGEPPGNKNMCVAFGLNRHFAHLLSFRFFDFVARISSSLS